MSLLSVRVDCINGYEEFSFRKFPESTEIFPHMIFEKIN